jgi:[pyruvate, water dikinase]-phosphate phosphotransferase / [pyruvate, water dikinase] kinase
MTKRTAFFVSDRTGLTAEILGRSLLSQFGGIEFQRVTLPYLDTAEQAVAYCKAWNDNQASNAFWSPP